MEFLWIMVFLWLLLNVSCIYFGGPPQHGKKKQMYCGILMTVNSQRNESRFPPVWYDKTETGEHDKALDVDLSLYIESVIRVDPNNMEVIIYSYLNQQWKDNRLARKNHHTVLLQDTSDIWVPDVYCLNCRESTLSSKENRVMLRVDLEGNIYYSQTGILHAACKFTFKAFPFDEQNCKIQLSSYSYNNSYINFKWKDGVTINTVNLDQFAVDRKPQTAALTKSYLSGNFTVLEVTLQFTRQTGFYVIRLFVPSAMLVCLSWVSFFVSPTEVGDRLAIGITLILSMIFLLGYVDSSLPKVSYVKAIDWYLIMALIMIVSSVVETVLVYWYLRKKKKKALQRLKVFDESMELLEKSKAELNGNHPEKLVSLDNTSLTQRRSHTSFCDVERKEIRDDIVGESYKKGDFITKVELSARVLFPFIYGVYNALYIYTYVYKTDPHL